MTPQLQPAIRILRLSRMELRNMVRDEMLANPILDVEPVGEIEMPAEETTDITPDVDIRGVGDRYIVAANDDGLPKLKISDSFRTAFARGREDVRIHQSVVSLVATNKYVHTPQGLYELKYFFSLGSP